MKNIVTLLILGFATNCYAASRTYYPDDVTCIKQTAGSTTTTFHTLSFGNQANNKNQFATTFYMWNKNTGQNLIPVNAVITAVKIQYTGTCPAFKCGLLNSFYALDLTWNTSSSGFTSDEYQTLFDTFSTTTTQQTVTLGGSEADWIIERMWSGQNIPIVVIGNDSSSVARQFGSFNLIFEYTVPPPITFHIHSPLGIKSRLGEFTANITLSAPLSHNLIVLIFPEPVAYEPYDADPARVYNQNSATADVDFTATGWSTLVPAGETSVTGIVIPVNPDGVSDVPRAFKLRAQLASYSNINTSDISDQVTILGGKYGDVNSDGVFNTADFLVMFQAGKYETGQTAGWEQGDMNGDGLFTTDDLIIMLQAGTYNGTQNALAADVDYYFGE